MINRVAVLPHPPLLVPELVTGAVEDTDELRTACLRAASSLCSAAQEWLVVAAGDDPVAGSEVGTFGGFGVDVRVNLSEDSILRDTRTRSAGTCGKSVARPGLGILRDTRTRSAGACGKSVARPGLRDSADEPVAPDPLMPLPLLVAGWLRGKVGAKRVRGSFVEQDASAEECRRIGAKLAGEADPVGLLVLGDGSARHGDHAPLARDDRAAAFDEAVAAALGAADAGALLSLDASLADELAASGRAAWQVLAGAVLADGGNRWRGELLYSAAPYGVGYHVAIWDRTER